MLPYERAQSVDICSPRRYVLLHCTIPCVSSHPTILQEPTQLNPTSQRSMQTSAQNEVLPQVRQGCHRRVSPLPPTITRPFILPATAHRTETEQGCSTLLCYRFVDCHPTLLRPSMPCDWGISASSSATVDGIPYALTASTSNSSLFVWFQSPISGRTTTTSSTPGLSKFVTLYPLPAMFTTSQPTQHCAK